MPLEPVKYPRALACVALALLAGACSNASSSTTASCGAAAASALSECVTTVNEATRQCYLATGKACAGADAGIQKAYAAVGTSVTAACKDDAAVRQAGYGQLFTTTTLTERLQGACRDETRALAARSFGGPQGAALAAADAAGRDCLAAAHEQGALLLSGALETRSECIAQLQSGGNCDASAAAADIAQAKSAAEASIGASCPALQDLIALEPAAFLARTELQAQCLTAVANPDTAPFAVACGPRDEVPAVPRGQWTQVVLDEHVFGTRCGDGSPYAFQVQLAPEGSPVENVVVGMQGGGVCVFEDDCKNVSPDLFEALSDEPEQDGPLSSDPSFNPFASWTKVFLPYCTQDVFIGGGATSNFPSITVQRYGAIDTRAALQYVRDLVWRELDRESAEGYRADRMRVLFGGFSAGGFGTLYNYGYVLDDLQWQHTAAYPDASLALDNGQALGVRGLGAIAGSSTPPLGWGATAYLPPYCFATDCGVGPVILAATAPRLKEVPEEQFLVLSNQVDDTQVGTTYFATTADWINQLRTSYCATRDLNGVHYYLPAVPQSNHVISVRPEFYTGSVDGVVLRDWLADAFTDPAAIQNQVVEGTLVQAFPGVDPFPCPVAP